MRFIREASSIVAGIGGFHVQQQLLVSFASLVENPTPAAASNLGGYIGTPQNAKLKDAMDWRKQSTDAVSCLSLFRLLAARADSSTKQSRRRHNDTGKADTASLGATEAAVAMEWQTLKRVLRTLDDSTCAGGKIDLKALAKSRRRLEQLRFLQFLVPPYDEIELQLLPRSRSRQGNS